jgi:hypothetical protein
MDHCFLFLYIYIASVTTDGAHGLKCHVKDYPAVAYFFHTSRLVLFQEEITPEVCS